LALNVYIYCSVHVVGIVVSHKMTIGLINSINHIEKIEFGFKSTYILDLKPNLISSMTLIEIITIMSII